MRLSEDMTLVAGLRASDAFGEIASGLTYGRLPKFRNDNPRERCVDDDRRRNFRSVLLETLVIAKEDRSRPVKSPISRNSCKGSFMLAAHDT